jgi:hypothetical protein
MKKLTWMILMVILFVTGTAFSFPPTPPGGSAVYTASNCNVAAYYDIGTLCQDTDDGNLYKGTGAAVEEIGVGTGDVTGVGDCASGACLDGSSNGGTYIRLYDGDSNYTAIYGGNSSSNLSFYFPTTAGATGGIFYFSGANQLANLAAGATGKVLIAKGAAAPEWTPYTFPATVPTVGKVFISDGTNMIGSTALNTAAYAATGDFAPATTITAGADASKGNCTDGAAFYYGTDTHILYHCSATNTWTQVYGVGADGSYQMTITNNTAIAPTASANQLYPEANVWKAVQNGTESSVCIGPTAGQVTFTGPTQARSYALPDAGSLTLATLTGSETLTNKTLTAPLVTLPRVAGGAADLSLSAAQVSGTIITNAGQGVVDRNHTLPAAAEGYNFVGFVGTAVAATNYYRFTAATAATMCLDGTCGKAYVTIDTPTQGASVVCYTEQVSSTGMSTATALSAATATDDVKNTAATIDIAGQVYAVAAADGTAPGDDVIVAAKWGAVAFDVGVNGTIDAVEETGQAADQHADEAAAIAALAAQNPEAGHVRIGYVTASKSDGTFTFGTDALVTAGTTTANFYNTTAYTKPFNWICTTGAGTWVTD